MRHARGGPPVIESTVLHGVLFGSPDLFQWDRKAVDAGRPFLTICERSKFVGNEYGFIPIDRICLCENRVQIMGHTYFTPFDFGLDSNRCRRFAYYDQTTSKQPVRKCYSARLTEL